MNDVKILVNSRGVSAINSLSYYPDLKCYGLHLNENRRMNYWRYTKTYIVIQWEDEGYK